MSAVPNILFVCTGNICRSPAAEIIFHHKASALLDSPDFKCDSAGTIAYHAGEPPDQRMQRTLSSSGYQSFGRSRHVRSKDFDEFDYILAMDKSHLLQLERMSLTGSGNAHATVALFCEFCGIDEVDEIPDPYYGGSEGFFNVMRLVERGCDEIIRKIKTGEI